ncbi:MAG: ABC transporter ATP-binding protein [Chloroflexi bacterium HGW-Chloroflexi-3]|nr:MAG: ABC transporter ATP-binding protein [Chloroflexi bacterium HGW-Chloroflexi-3]
MIKIHKLTKNYGKNRGVLNLDFEIPQGEIFGYLGPNGAGKTTTIRLLLGFLNPDEGCCVIKNLDCRKEAAEIQKFVGYLPGEIEFLDGMYAYEFLNLIANMRRLKSNYKKERLIDILELDTKGKIRKMSKGMKQKLGLVAAMMHDPEILILDEPTSGLDPLMQQRFVSLIKEEKTAGKTVLMSSHSFEEIEHTCDRAGIIREGNLVTVEDISVLQASQRKSYTVTFKNSSSVQEFLKFGFKIMSSNSNIVEVEIQDNLKEFLEVLTRLDVIGLDTVKLSLENVFMQYYGKEDKND